MYLLVPLYLVASMKSGNRQDEWRVRKRAGLGCGPSRYLLHGEGRNDRLDISVQCILYYEELIERLTSC